MTAMALTGCGSAANAEASESPALEASAVPASVEEPSNAVLAATEEIVGAAQQAAEAKKTPEEEFEALKENLVYMGGLCIHDPNSDLMMAIFKNDGEPIAVIYELGNTYYGEFTTESG